MPDEVIDVKEATSTEVAVPVDDAIGLEDFEDDDQVMPRLQIVQKEAVFEDNLTGERYDELDVVLLGLVKQRVLWPPEMEADSFPLCKSYEAKDGHPTDKFPWKASGFDPSAYPDEDAVLPCANCKLKEWDSHPTRDIPWCGEQYVLPLVMKATGDKVVPALLTFQRSSIKPVKAYISGFATRAEPLFTVHTHIVLNARRRGNVDFAIPKLRRGDAVEADRFDDLGAAYRKAAAFLRTPRTPSEEGDVTGAAASRTNDGDSKTAGQSAANTAAAAPATPEQAAPEASSVEDDDELF